MRWGAIIIGISIGFLIALGYRMMVGNTTGFLLIYDMDGYQEVYEILPHGSDGYIVFGTSARDGEARCLISITDSMGMVRRNLMLSGPYCSSAYGNGGLYVVRMYDTLVSMGRDMGTRWKVHLDNRITPDITDLIDGYSDSYYYAVGGGEGRYLHLLDMNGTLLKSIRLGEGMGPVAIEVDSCGHVHVAMEEEGRVVLLELVDSGLVWSRVLDFGALFGSERGVPVTLLWKGGRLYLFADAVRGDMSSPVYVVVMEGGDVEDYGRIDGQGYLGDAVVFYGHIAVGYNDPLGGFLVKLFDEDMEPLWSLRSDRGIITDMTQGHSGQLVMTGNIPEEGNFFIGFADRDGRWITR